MSNHERDPITITLRAFAKTLCERLDIMVDQLEKIAARLRSVEDKTTKAGPKRGGRA
jgi:hypothetical protein